VAHPFLALESGEWDRLGDAAGLMVLDVDGQHGIDSLAERAGALGVGLDVRVGSNGYIVVAPR